jgi:hypothetical protein
LLLGIPSIHSSHKGYFFLALVATLIFTSMAKFPVGRLRPHFIDLCNPRIGNESESEYCLKPVNQHRYVDVERYSCDDGVSPALISEARLSFYSGHSSLAMCTAVFTAVSKSKHGLGGGIMAKSNLFYLTPTLFYQSFGI